MTAIAMDGVVKRYGASPALDGLDLTVAEGSVHGLLGPNGAGKTTAVRVLSTLLRYDAGNAQVAGFDVARQAGEVRERIALTGQYAAVDEILSGRQNLTMFGRLFGLDARQARHRSDELLGRFGLTDVADKSAGQYSGGMRRRLDLASSLIRRPHVLFLDEPTAGLDPRTRNELWSAVRSIVADGTTVLLTTQYLEEADQLADTVSVIDHGRVVAEGSPDELKRRTGGDRIEVTVHDAADLVVAAETLARIGSGEVDADPDRRSVSVAVTDRMAGLAAAITALKDAAIEVEDVGVRRPTLDEAFLHLTGHATQEQETAV
jgi:ABC-2 type transport system ATP-binding protein